MITDLHYRQKGGQQSQDGVTGARPGREGRPELPPEQHQPHQPLRDSAGLHRDDLLAGQPEHGETERGPELHGAGPDGGRHVALRPRPGIQAGTGL